MIRKIILTSLLIVFSLKVTAQKNDTTITKNVADFKGISIGGPFEVVVFKSNETKIIISGSKNIINKITTTVDDGILKINYTKNSNLYAFEKTTIQVYYQNLKSVFLGGSGKISSFKDIYADDFWISLGGSGEIDVSLKAKTIQTAIGGSGNIHLKGTADTIKAKIAGSGNINAYGLDAKKLHVTIAGSGSMNANISETIEGKIIGSGNIYYKGKATDINTKSIGSGSVINKN